MYLLYFLYGAAIPNSWPTALVPGKVQFLNNYLPTIPPGAH